ncbi:nucleoside triphosphate pyrophosphohydrolase [Bisgaard Taxon 10/6]|uniref:nucleoside triphosphate pyrophosphohydrolase n=1 Tax=Exercitatus varius TaxID=67857 RepID=UPI00294AB54F|nr:nucleoside triphosphate pyrophosphohydrolase [Exercitatus varius]MDG2915656.1 nucleoside triphosphate pyrophosphohydrolase [Exercitatus varius]
MAYHIQDFVRLIAQLRNPKGGCPWDLKQNYRSMIPCLIEESYEVIDAIEQNNKENLREELGDLLMQVVFLSQLAAEDQLFTFDDVVNDVAEKIIRRHPHVFGEQSAGNEQEALAHWNAMKAQEKSRQTETSVLDNIPHAFPALLRAEKLQKKCSKIGFDWNHVDGVIAKVEEELDEVKQELNRPHLEQPKINEEIGDLLFAVVNLARHVKTQPEEALRQANHKFERRFRAVEQQVRQAGKNPADCTLAELDQLWDEVKLQESHN